MGGEIAVGMREKTMAVPQSEARERLERAIETTDIQFDSTALRGTYRVWWFTASYEWHIAGDDETTTIREEQRCNRATLAAFASILPVTALVVLLLLALLTVDWTSVAALWTTGEDGMPQFVWWPMYAALGAVVLLMSAAYLAMYRVNKFPSPLKDVDDAAVEERASSVWLGILGLGSVVFLPTVLLFAWFQLGSGILQRPAVQTGYALLTVVLATAATICVAILTRWNELDRLEISHGILTRFDESHLDLVTRYRVVQVRYNEVEETELRRKLGEAATRVGINLDPVIESVDETQQIGQGKLSKSGIEARYEWAIERHESDDEATAPDYLVTETMYVSRDFKVVLQYSALSAAALLLIDGGLLQAVVPFVGLAMPAFAGVAILVLGMIQLPGWIFPRGLDETDPACAVHLENLAISRAMLVIAGLFALGSLAPTDGVPLVQGLAALGLVIISVLVVTHYDELTGPLTERRTLLDLPPPMGDYLLLVPGPALPATFVLFGIAGMDLTSSQWYLLVNALLGAGMLWLVLRLCRSYRSLAVALFESRGGTYNDRTSIRYAAYCVAVVVSIATVVVPVVTAGRVFIRFGGFSSPLALVLAGLFLVPAMLPFAGTAYQLHSGYRDLRALFDASQPVTPETYDLPADMIDAQLRVYDGPIDGIYGLSTGRRDVIFFTERAAAVLAPDELAAVLAHEDAHTSVYKDGLFSVYSPLIAGITLVGRNVLLAALDFRAREFRADQHAAAVTSATAIADALRTIDHQQSKERAAQFTTAASQQRMPASSFSSFVPATDQGTPTDRVFGLLYGWYTMTSAHPTVEERIDRLGDTGAEEKATAVA